MNRNYQLECAMWKEKYSAEAELNIVLNAQLQEMKQEMERLKEECEKDA